MTESQTLSTSTGRTRHDSGAASHRTEDWNQIDWRRAERTVRRLQARIVKATQEGRWNKVQTLQRLLTHSYSGKALAAIRVTANRGKRTGRPLGRYGRGNLDHTASEDDRHTPPAAARLPASAAAEGVYPQKDGQSATPGYPDYARSRYAGTLPARAQPHRRDHGGREFLRLSTAPIHCRRHPEMLPLAQQESVATVDP